MEVLTQQRMYFILLPVLVLTSELALSSSPKPQTVQAWESCHKKDECHFVVGIGIGVCASFVIISKNQNSESVGVLSQKEDMCHLVVEQTQYQPQKRIYVTLLLALASAFVLAASSSSKPKQQKCLGPATKKDACCLVVMGISICISFIIISKIKNSESM